MLFIWVVLFLFLNGGLRDLSINVICFRDRTIAATTFAIGGEGSRLGSVTAEDDRVMIVVDDTPGPGNFER
jgi:hypothetical protein